MADAPYTITLPTMALAGTKIFVKTMGTTTVVVQHLQDTIQWHAAYAFREEEWKKMGRNELVDVTVHVHHETELAILVSDDGEEEHAVWLPKSQIQVEPVRGRAEEVVVTMPLWIAEDKGLV